MELSKIKWTIIGLSEAQLKSKGCIILNNTGHTMYYSGGNECQCGVGFVVNKSIAGNVVNFKGQSDRVAEITIRLNQWYQLKCIQVYMPTSSHPDEEEEQVYEDIDNILTAELVTIWSWETSMPKLDLDNTWKSALANMAWEKGTSKETCWLSLQSAMV